MKHRLKDLFLEDHDQINRLLYKFMKMQPHFFDNQALFKKIKFSVERHLYLEEKTIFSTIEKSPTDYRYINTILEQHDEIIAKIKEYDQKLRNNEDIDITVIGNMLKDNLDLGLQYIYDKLDSQLDLHDKNRFFNSISESSTKGFYSIEALRKYGLHQMKNIFTKRTS